MLSIEEIEGFLMDLGATYDRIDEGMWVVHDDEEHIPNTVVYVEDKLVSFRVKLFEVGSTPSVDVLKKLLELNASEVVHGAYGLVDEAVILSGALQRENLDANEFSAMFDSIALAASSHYAVLKELI